MDCGWIQIFGTTYFDILQQYPIPDPNKFKLHDFYWLQLTQIRNNASINVNAYEQLTDICYPFMKIFIVNANAYDAEQLISAIQRPRNTFEYFFISHHIAGPDESHEGLLNVI